MRYSKFLVTIWLIFLISACATLPEEMGPVPDWFTNPPTDNDEFLYFTVSEQVTNSEDPNIQAGETLYEKVIDTIGITSKESMMEDLDEFRQGILGLVSGGSAPGFTLIDKQINEHPKGKVIYILVRLKRVELDKIEDYLLDILKAGSSASIYTDEADEFVKNGDIYNGALSYIKAALEAADSANRFITEKNLSSAIEQLKKISMIKGVYPETIAVGKNSVFSASLILNEGDIKPQWSRVSVKVTFRDRKKGSIIGDRFAQLRSDKEGLITFVHPSPGFTGDGRVDVTLDLLRDTGSLSILENGYKSELDELLEAAGEIQVTFDFDIVSSAPYVPTGILIVDSDFLRKPLETVNTAEGLSGNLSNSGFNISIMDQGRSELLNKSEAEFLRDLPYLVDHGIKRVVYGVARITVFDDSPAGFTVVTAADIKVVDLDTGEILFNGTLSKRVQGGESQLTINTSFKELGKSFSSILIDKLP